MEYNTANFVHKQVYEYLHKFSSDYILDKDKFEKLMSLCNMADMIMAEFEGESITVIVDPALTNGTISVCLPEIVLEYGRKHPIFTFLKNADFLRFVQNPKDKLCMQFGVRDLWAAG